MSDKPTTGPEAALECLVALGEARFESLMSALDRTHRFSSRAELRSAMKAALPDVPAESTDNLLDFAIAYAEVAVERDLASDKKFLKSIVRMASVEDLACTQEQLTGLVLRLLQAPALELNVHSSVAMRRHVDAVVRTSIQTDLRPVFSEAYGESPANYVIWHTLRVVKTSDLYGDDETVIELSLDHRDLDALIKQATDSLERHVMLQGQLGATGAVVYDPQGVSEDDDDE